MADTVLARVIIEMLGAPKEHIEKTMRDYVEKLRKELSILKVDFAEAEQVEEGKIFTTHAELEIKFPDLAELLDFCFESMPSSVEVVEPGVMSIPLNKLNGFLNDLQARLHEADAIVKSGKIQQQILDANATNIFRRFLIALAEHGHSTASEMSHYVGVHPSKLTAFLDKLVEDKKLKKEGEKYLLP
jgi:DNA-directed RNA polymerase subunit E'/Rpb7